MDGSVNNETKIYLVQPETLRDVAASYFGQVIDSAQVNPDGSFAFHHTPDTKEPLLLELAIQTSGQYPNFILTEDPLRSNCMLVFWQPGEHLEITAGLDQFQKNFSVKQPSKMNRALSDLRDIRANAFQTFLAEKNWELEKGTQLLDKEQAVLNYQKQLMNYADTTHNLIPALVAIRWVSPVNDFERVAEFIVRQCKKWQKTNPDHPWVQELCRDGDPANLPYLVGDKLPDLSFPLVSKDTLSLIDLLGNKITILDLWASWCAPCRVENRKVLVPLWDDFHEQGLQIIACALESDESVWKAAIRRDGADRWPQASHLQGDHEPLMEALRVETIPTNYIIDHEGMVLARNIHGEQLYEFVKDYLSGNN